MSEPIPFLAPRLVGKRFESHAVPLEVLKDLAVLDEIIKETAKWRFLQAHPTRKRVPRGFTEEISLRVADIEPGSAIPKIMLFLLAGELISPHQLYFEQARESVIAAIDAAGGGGSITNHLPDTILPHFDAFGRSLLEDEAIEFRPENPEHPARLDRIVRRKLILASSRTQALTEEVVLRGTVPEADQERQSFELQVINGPKIPAPIEPYHLDTILEAFNGFRSHVRVAVRGIAKFNRNNRLQSIESIEDINVLDPNDVGARLDELRALEDGWLDGIGTAPTPDGLAWFGKEFDNRFPPDLALPFLYPTAEGGIQLEWSLPPLEISLEIDLASKRGDWHGIHLESGEESVFVHDLGQTEAWEAIAREIRKSGGVLG